ncbi:NAD(P)/FAD-dependent oxidoreductase [Larsenimonas rhizosphaerae]|uniref:FAD/NAD(P)-binding oxidoreductase n=1 Tax=Larsenimonas rhizosphaerae TaxID=2944682 RepID=A0AA42CY59_9GAMM|nr:FAD/NAD(P)-binding oxidoreductase [Larsenimonas rhizosphaerae]MCM2131941.1 NAD(P)/FAD-dependent oxidoreductase [Larsenimonas rhizosphaerae]MCX2524753.1 FAD/NAD(P)-binding oxidoreductase [Larsenimonas rhizosphaerae]
METLNSDAKHGRYDVVIIGGGAGGISVAASLLKRRSSLDIAIIEPSETHYYQPGWTLVGAGIIDVERTQRAMEDVMPKKVTWYRQKARSVAPRRGWVILASGMRLHYRCLVVAVGMVMNWKGVEGLEETLGDHGVTSNYRPGLAAYTCSLITSMNQGRALFTQPTSTIKCAGAPQKAMYMACSNWLSRGVSSGIDVHFHSGQSVLYGVCEFVPALEGYIQHYDINNHLSDALVAVDGPCQRAWFRTQTSTGDREYDVPFDMLHVVPPHSPPWLIQDSGLADAHGWLDVMPETLQHRFFDTIFGIGDICNTDNAKTAAAVRHQAPVVAENVLSRLKERPLSAFYHGYGACPLMVEHGRAMLAEFDYNRKPVPAFPAWLVNGKRASRRAWYIKVHVLPWLYWNGMLKGHEWLVQPEGEPLLRHDMP